MTNSKLRAMVEKYLKVETTVLPVGGVVHMCLHCPICDVRKYICLELEQEVVREISHKEDCYWFENQEEKTNEED